jgi:SPP1 family predicted phage head-tail adaptor
MPQQHMASRLDRRLRIERPEPDSSFSGAGSGSWTLVAEVAAEVRDLLPSRSERVESGINMATRRARVLIRYRADIRPDMRFVMEGRVMQIVSGPAELGRREALEFMVEDYSTAAGGV